MSRAITCLLEASFQCHVPAEPDSFVLVYTVPAMAASKQRPIIEASAKSVAVTAPKARKGR